MASGPGLPADDTTLHACRRAECAALLGELAGRDDFALGGARAPLGAVHQRWWSPAVPMALALRTRSSGTARGGLLISAVA